MRVLAPAKLNVYLRVLGKRPDGYHDVNTLMIPVTLYDELHVEPQRDEINVETRGLDISREDNLAYKAARRFIDTTGINTGVHVRIVKHIPAGAGLGGGSSDAAGVLLAMNRLFKAGLNEQDLASMAADIGADCPFFIMGRPFVMVGRGDIPAREVHIEDRIFLVIVPSFSLNTVEVYSSLDHFRPGVDNYIDASIKAMDSTRPVAPEDLLVNDLEEVVFSRHPEIRDIKQELLDAGALGAIMTGSGSAVFGVFKDYDHVENALKSMGKCEGNRYLCTTIFGGG